MTYSDVPKVLEAYKKVPPESSLNLAFEHTCFFNIGNLKSDIGWAYYQEGASTYYGAVNLDKPETNPDEFLLRLSELPSIKRIYAREDNQSQVLSGLKGKHARGYIYIFDNNPNAIKMLGTDYRRFRTAHKYLDNPDIRIEQFHVQNPLTSEAVLAILNINVIWHKYQSDNGNRPSYDIDRCVKAIYSHGKISDYLVTLIWYKGTLLHYHTSERLNKNFVVLLDSKTNFSIDKELEREFQYVTFLDHWLHLSFWDNKLRSEVPEDVYLKYPIYYHTGMSDKDSYKDRLRPAIKSRLMVYLAADFTTYPVEKTNDLF